MIFDQKIIFKQNINKEINKIIENFVDDLEDKNQSYEYYVKERHANSKKVKMDNALGKKGEFFTAKFLNKYCDYPTDIIPDLNIYDSKNKSWESDLPYKNIDENLFNVHVKTCNQLTFQYAKDYTWTFQNSNLNTAGGKDSILINSENDLISLVYIDDYKSNVGYIKFLGKFAKIKHLLKNPISPKLLNIKKCIYFSDL